MPFYNVSVGFAVTDTAAASIVSNGIPVSIYPTPVRVINSYSSKNQTVFQIEADDLIIANEWADKLLPAIKQVTEYTPPAVENPDPPPAALDVWARVGTWTKTIAAGTTVISGLPSAPKGVILWGSGLSAAVTGTYSEAGATVIGFSNGTVNRNYAYVAQDNLSPANANRSIGNKAFQLVDPTGNDTTHITAESGNVTFGATSFTIIWSATTLATTGFYYAFGGNDITQVEIKDFQCGTTSIGPHTYSGLAQRNDFCILLQPHIVGITLPLATTVGAAEGLMSISAHAGANNSKSWCTNIRTEDNIATTSSWRLQRRGKLFNTMGVGTSVRQLDAEWLGWTDDGFELNYIDSPDATDHIFTGMFVKGGNWDAGFFQQPTTVGQVTTIANPSTSLIKGIMGFSISSGDLTTWTAGTAAAKLVIGAEDSSGNRRCLAYANNPTNPSQEATVMVTDKFMKHTTAAATAASSTVPAECVVSDIATAGKFTINYSTVDTTSRQTVWFALLS
jgi:hypothetical protein